MTRTDAPMGFDGEIEHPPPKEELYINKLTDLLKQTVLSSYPPGKTLRDAHPKQHGTVAAQFVVEPNLPEELRVAIFSEPVTYNAFIRFSNANPVVSADKRRDVRGMAIKLLGVKGKKVLDDESESTTNDIVLISYDVFLTKDVQEMYEFTRAYEAGPLHILWYWFNPFKPHLRVFWNFIVPFRVATSPLDLRYYSMTPYLFGENAVKYSAMPWPHMPSAVPDPPTDNFLRESLQRHLERGPMQFDFMVQLRRDPKQMPIEDAGKRWSQRLSPFIKVATIIIPMQEFETAQKMDFGDNLSFNPWRCLPEQRPLGGINRARKVAYWTISKLRHEQNAMRQVEPGEQEFKHFWDDNVTNERTTWHGQSDLGSETGNWSKVQLWVKVYSVVTIAAALYGIAYAHIPPILGFPWSVCTGPNQIWSKLSIHLFEVPIALYNLYVAWYGLSQFSLGTILRYMSLLNFAVTFNMVFFLFETNLLLEGLSRSFPFWELFAFASIAVILLAGTVFTMFLKLLLDKERETIGTSQV